MADPDSTTPSKQDNRICEHCQNPQNHKMFYCRAILEIKNASSLGCPICSLLLIAIEAIIPNLYTTPYWRYDLIQCGTMKNKDIFSKFCYIKFNPGKGVRAKPPEIELFSPNQLIILGGNYIIAEQKIVPPQTISDDSIHHVQKWLDDCLANHPYCQPPKWTAGITPARLLRILPEPETLELIDYPNAGVPYLCLSHCWGNNLSEFKTTTENLLERKIGIEFSEMPTVFQHVVSFTRRLGFEYLWVDSLCIVQNDVLDWDRESAKMACIYQNSILTLAASTAKNSDENMFCIPNKTSIGHRLNGVEELGFQGPIYARISLPHDLRESSLMSRGWVYQERLLSPRFLQFCSLELVWECNTKTTCQCSIDPFPDDWQKFCRPKLDHSDKLSMDPHTRFSRWRNIVEEYSGLNLTFLRDKLPAIAGMAKQMQKFRPRNDKYLAGLWESSILDDIAWVAISSSSPRHFDWCAPTFSWASIRGAVSYHAVHGVNRIAMPRHEWEFTLNWEGVQYLEGNSVLEGTDEMMRLKSAYIKIRSLFISSILKFSNGTTENKEEYTVLINNISSTRFYNDYDFKHHDLYCILPDAVVFCLIIKETPLGTFCLVLKSTNHGPNTYERIGLAEFGADFLKDNQQLFRTETCIIV